MRPRLTSTPFPYTTLFRSTVRGQNGQIGYSPCWGGPVNVSVINQGTISSDSGGQITVNARPLSNQGVGPEVHTCALQSHTSLDNRRMLVKTGKRALNLGGN